MSSLLVRGVLVGLAVLGSAVVVDLLVVTDEEALEGFVEEVVHGRDIDAALDWVDTARVPVDVVEHRTREEYDDDDGALAERMRRTLDPLDDPEAKVVSETIELDGERATVAFRLRTGDGLHDLSFGMVRRADGWLVSRVRAL